VNTSDHWERGDPYEEYIGRWSRLVAPAFLTWLGLPPGRRWLDVGCGTGAVSAAILAQTSPAGVFAVEPSPGFAAVARARLAGRVAIARAAATALPCADSSVDVACCGLVLNFVPDTAGALAEFSRVTSPGGTVAAYVWDYAAAMALVRHFWDAAVALDPAAAPLDEAVRFPLCHPDALRASFDRAGLGEVAVTAIDVPTPFASFADYWRPFLGGQGPAPAYAMALDAPARARLRDTLERRVPAQPDGSLALTARAWAIRGTTPR
jgi:SAM-dependent methyltransferase